MTRLLLVAAVLALGSAAPAGAQEICQGSVDRLVCQSRINRCDYVDCTPPYVGCIQGYFCV